MRFLHYSPRPLSLGDLYQPAEKLVGSKPRGIWLSVGDEWRRWCEERSHNLHRLEYEYEVVLRDSASMISITRPEEIDSFGRAYSASPGRTVRHVRWGDLSRRHDGIIIAPYFREKAEDKRSEWYSKWNCACACVWNVSAIGDMRCTSSSPAS